MTLLSRSGQHFFNYRQLNLFNDEYSVCSFNHWHIPIWYHKAFSLRFLKLLIPHSSFLIFTSIPQTNQLRQTQITINCWFAKWGRSSQIGMLTETLCTNRTWRIGKGGVWRGRMRASKVQGGERSSRMPCFSREEHMENFQFDFEWIQIPNISPGF